MSVYQKDSLFSDGIRTYTGHYFNPVNIDQDSITIEAIAHALSLQCRFAGHVKKFFSVAQHSIAVAKRVPSCDRLTALLHDASEAYLMDIPKPIKNLLPDYMKLELNVNEAIANKFAIEFPYPKSIKEADLIELNREWEGNVLRNTFRYVSPEMVEKEFIELFWRFYG